MSAPTPVPAHGAALWWVAFSTIVRKEFARVIRIWGQTLLPPAVTMSLYFVIFGAFIGSRVGEVGGVAYIDFLVPGLVMMAVITNAYGNVSSSFFGSKFGRYVEELQVSPVPDWVILAGYVAGGVLRGLLVGLIVIGVSLCFTRVPVAHPVLIVLTLLLTAVVFSLAAFINAVYAKKFDDVAIVPNFVLTPLTYLGGVFYSITLLPPFWQQVSLLNPILYMVNAFRYGFLDRSDVPVGASLGLTIVLIGVLTAYCLRLMRKGTGLRS
jgi:ABC-2 type transport system permease protein